MPPGFVPTQDKQYLVSFAQLPERRHARPHRGGDPRRCRDIALKQPGVESAVAFPGLSINGFINSPNAGIVFVTLKPFEERTRPDLSATAIAQTLNQKYDGIQDAFDRDLPAAAGQGLGTIGGFKLQVEDRADLGDDALDRAMQTIHRQGGARRPALAGVFSSFKINVPQLYADVDRTKAKQLGVAVQDVFDTMQIYLGSLYVNDFNRFGRTYQVIAQADTPFRSHADDILRLKTRNADGEMVPLGVARAR